MNGKIIENTNELKLELSWIKDNIIQSGNDFLYKQKCKEVYPQFSKTFFENIEKYCNTKFCNKQIQGIKYNQIISGYTLKLI